MNPYKKISIALVFLGVFALTLSPLARWTKQLLEERLPDELRLDKIALDRCEGLPEFDLPDLAHLEGQVFTYIGHGGQAVAFASQDQRLVLKFFLEKQLHGPKRFAVPKPTHWISSHREKRRKEREQKRYRSLMKAMGNYAIAFDKIGEKTGILALHLNASSHDLPRVILEDMEGRRFPLDLARASFVLQHRAELVQEKLSRAASDEDKRAILLALNHFFEQRAKSGFIDIERSFMIEANYGFLGDTPIQLDVGNIEFLEEQQLAPEREVERIQGLLRNWAKTKGLPEL